MDKYEYKVKLAQIEKLVAKKDFVTAAKIADGIDWRKVKSATTLNMIADIYEANNRLEDCYEILNMVYDRSPVGRRIVYRMTRVATKMHDFEEAIDLYKEFVRLAPHDLNRYILKYHIYRERGSSVTDQITILEEYKSHEYDEQWAYELACLYEEAGLYDQCVEECDELILWFSEGEYVAKAMELKMKYQQLTASQQEKFEHRYDYLTQEDSSVIEESEETVAEEAEVVEEAEEIKTVQPTFTTVQPVMETPEEEDDTPQVSVINTNKFSTMNLQEELAKGLQMILAQVEEENEELPAEETPDTQEFIPVKEVVIAREEPAVEGAVLVDPVVDEPVPAETEIEDAVPAEPTVEETVPVEPVPAEPAMAETEVEEVPTEEPVVAVKPAVQEKSLSETAELRTEILKYVAVPQERKMEEMFRTEDDGQISLAIGEENVLEKQITGQLTIEEILAAWDEKKRLAKEKMEKSGEKKEAVLFETSEITGLLDDFIPKTPKDVQELIEEIETETETAEPLVETHLAETAEKSAEILVETAEIPEEFVEIPEEELEDDLPMDIDFAEALEAALEEPQKEAEPEKVEKPVEEVEEETVERKAEELAGQNTASMLDAIERALAMEITPMETSGKYLTEEQEKIFAYFTSVSGMKKQLVELLAEDSVYAGMEDSGIGNLIITGHPGNGKTTLAIDIVKAFQKQRKIKGGKLAKVTGDGLNKKDPVDVVKKLGGGALIIERAGSMRAEIVEKLSEAMAGPTGGLLVILEDDANEIAALMEKHHEFAVKFNRTIDIPIFSNDELVAFGKSYAEEQEYYFDEMAVLALYDCIGVRQTSDHVVNVAEVKEFVDDAIAHAEKKSKGLFARLSKKRIDEDGNKLLLEEDFDY